MSAESFQPYLDHLLHVSHAVGCNERFVQAGGGNTSVKTHDGTAMLIKASGTPLSRMSAERGWVAVKLPPVRELLKRRDLRSMSDTERERSVLDALYAAVIEPKDARPSVESPLHALLDRVVAHGHPVAAVALGCNPECERLLARICEGVSQRPPLWVPYVDPGSTLAFAVADRVDEYVMKHGGAPDVVMQPNHGIFVAADTAAGCVDKFQAIVDRAERVLMDNLPPTAEKFVMDTVEAAVRGVYDAGALVRFSRRPELVQAARSEYASIFTSALSPDHVVYTGPRAVIVDAGIGQEALEAAVIEFRDTYRMLPKLILLRGATICIVEQSEKKLLAAEALAVSAMQAAMLTNNHLQYLSPKAVSFIMNWEVEHYRAKQ